MGKNKAKTWKHKWVKIKRIIKSHRKTYLWNLFIFVSLVIVVGVILIFYLRNSLIIEKQMLFWFFAATSQSMAALFAVVGMFAVFRLESIKTKLRNCYDLLKLKFSSNGWIYYFGLINADCWHDDNILSCAEYRLDEKKDRLPGNIKNDLQASIIEISHLENVRDRMPKNANIPMVSILITFILSIVFLPLSTSLSKNCLGLIILLIMLGLIIFSMISIFGYFKGTISSK